LEFHQVGDYVKVSAIGARTNVETLIVGSPRTTQQQLTQIAVRKLDYILKKGAASLMPSPGRAHSPKAMRGATRALYVSSDPLRFCPRPIFLANSERRLA